MSVHYSETEPGKKSPFPNINQKKQPNMGQSKYSSTTRTASVCGGDISPRLLLQPSRHLQRYVLSA